MKRVGNTTYAYDRRVKYEEGAMNSEQKTQKTELDHYQPDELSDLYKNDPKHFDELAEEALSKACIGKTPEHTLKLRRLQWIIDTQLRKASTPAARLQVMERIFYGKVFGADGELAQLMDSCKELLRATGYVTVQPRTEQAPVRKPRLYLVKG